MLIELGNSAALEPQPGTYTEEVSSEPVRIEGDQVTSVEVPDSTKLDAALTEIKEVWKLHSESDAPDWVEGNNDLLVAAVASTFGCPVGRDNVESESDTPDVEDAPDES